MARKRKASPAKAPIAKASPPKAARQQRRIARALFERSGLRDAIVLVVALKVAAILLVFDTKGLDAFDMPKTIVSHAFAWLLAGLLATAIVRHGHEIVPRTKLHFFVVAFLAAAVVSTVFAANTYVAIFGERDRFEGLTYLADMAVLYLAIAVAFRTTRDWAVLLGAAGAACAISLGYAFVQVAGLDPNKWALNTQGRPFGTFGHPDTFGELLAIAFGVALAVAVFAPATRRSLRIGAVVAALALLAGMGVVATRASALGIAAAVVAVPLVLLRTRSLSRGDLARLAAIAGIVVIAGVALVFASSLGSRLRATIGGYAVQDRIVIYENALHAFVDRPIAGWGVDNFAVAYPHYKMPNDIPLHGISTIDTTAHDWPLQTAATMGVLGLGTLLALIGAAVVLLWRRGLARMPAVTAPLLVGAAAYWASGLVTPNALDLDWYVWVVFGAAAAIAGARLAEDPERRRSGSALWVPTYAALAVGLFIAYQTGMADREALTAQLYINAKDPATAIQHAQEAVTLDPGRARYWSILGAGDQAAFKWRDAEKAHGEAARRAPYIDSYWVNLARSYAGQAVSGDDPASAKPAALDAARRAIASDPNEPVPHATLAEVAIDLGNDEPLAQSEITRAITLYPGYADFERVAVIVASKDADPKDAFAFLDHLLRIRDSATLRVAAAQAAAKAGETAAARDNAQRALQLDPNNADAKTLLSSLGG